MTSNFEPCRGRRLLGCSLEIRSVLLSWLKHGLFRMFLACHKGVKSDRGTRVLGWFPGILTMVLAGILFWFTSITMHQYIMKNPHIKDICDFGYSVFGKNRLAYEFSGFMLLANNILLIGFHILTAAKVFNTLSDHSQCTVVFSVIGTLIGIVMSIPRTLKHVSFMSIFSCEYWGVNLFRA